MFPTLWNDITSFSLTQHLMCETGLQADAQAFGIGRSCRRLDMEIGVTLCVETCSGSVAQASLNLTPPASAFVCWDGRWVLARIPVSFLS